jgi:hypothetical protein
VSKYNRRLIITESEKREILSLYGLIREVGEDKPQTEASTSALKFDKTINFAPGYYRYKGPVTTKAGTTYNWDVDQTLKTDLDKIKEFLKNNPTGYIVEVNLYSGESKIPNNDNEQGGAQVKENHLNEARLNSLKSYLNPIFETWKTEGITKTDFKINEYKNIGETPWVGTPFCPANTTDERACTTTYYNKVKAGDKTTLDYKNKYDKEQYFRVIIEVKKVESPQTPTPTGSTQKTEDCVTGLRIRVDVDEHDCNNAEFFVFLNDTLLYNVDGGYTANGNNSDSYIEADDGSIIRPKRLNPGYGFLGTTKYGTNGDNGNKRYDEFIVTPEQSKKIIGQSTNNKINVWYICTLSTGCHLDTPTVTIFKDKTQVYKGKPMSDSSLLVTLDKCGNKADSNVDETAVEPNVTTYRTKLQSDRSSMSVPKEGDIPDTKDKKQTLLKASNTLNLMLDYINKTFVHPTISTIYFRKFPKTPPKGGAEYSRTEGGTLMYYGYNIPENKVLFDWATTQQNEGSIDDYVAKINELINKNGYEINKKGEYKNKTIRDDELYGDVRNNLSNFYSDASSLLDIDDSGQVSLKDLDTYNLLKRIKNPGKVYSERNADLKTT